MRPAPICGSLRGAVRAHKWSLASEVDVGSATCQKQDQSELVLQLWFPVPPLHQLPGCFSESSLILCQPFSLVLATVPSKCGFTQTWPT